VSSVAVTVRHVYWPFKDVSLLFQ